MPVRSPVLRGYLTGQQANAQEQAQGLQQLQGILGLQGALQNQQMTPFRLMLLQAQIKAAQGQESERAARVEELNQKLLQGRQQQQGQLGLARYLAQPYQPAGGAPAPSGVFTNEPDALAAMMQAEAKGLLARYDVADPSKVRALSVLASPTAATSEILQGLRPKEPLSPVGKLRKDFAQGVITEDQFKEAYQKAVTIQSPVQVNMPSTTGQNVVKGSSLGAEYDPDKDYVVAYQIGRDNKLVRTVVGEAGARPKAGQAGPVDLSAVEKDLARLKALVKKSPVSTATIAAPVMQAYESVTALGREISGMKPKPLEDAPASEKHVIVQRLITSMAALVGSGRMSNELAKRYADQLKSNVPEVMIDAIDNVMPIVTTAMAGRGRAVPAVPGTKKKPAEMSNEELLNLFTTTPAAQ